MIIFKGRNVVVKVALLLAVVFSGTSVWAADTVSLDVELTPYISPWHVPGHKLKIGDSFLLTAQEHQTPVSDTCVLKKGQSYDLVIWPVSDLYGGGYEASITPMSGIVIDDPSVLGDHIYDYGVTHSTKIHIPEITYRGYEFNPGQGGGAGVSYVNIFMNCEPNVTECIDAVNIKWTAVANSGAEVPVEKTTTLDGRFPISETNTPVYVQASYGGKMLYKKSWTYDGDQKDLSEEEMKNLVVKYQKMKSTKEPIDTKTGNNYFTIHHPVFP